MKEENKKNTLSRAISWIAIFIDEKLPIFFSKFFWVVGQLFSALIVMIIIFLFCFRAIDYIIG